MYIHISNLNKQITPADIYSLLAAYMSIGYCAIRHIRNTETRQVNTFAIVDITDAVEAQTIVNLLDGKLLGGRKIVIQIGG